MRKVCEEIRVAVKFNLKHFTEDVHDLICDSCGLLYVYCEDFKFPSVLMLNQFYSFCSGYCKWEHISDIRKIQRIRKSGDPVLSAGVCGSIGDSSIIIDV